MSEILQNNDVLAGEVSAIADRRSAIKLADCPGIIICVPVGGKEDATEFETPDGQRWRQPGNRANGLVPVQWVLAQLGWVSPLNVAVSYMIQWGMMSAKARQIMTAKVLSDFPETKYIFYVDDDTLVPPLGLYTLHNFMERNPEVGAVTGSYVTRQSPPEPVIYKTHGAGAYWGFTSGLAGVPEEIFACGAGCLLVRVNALRAVQEMLGPTQPLWTDEVATEVDTGGMPLKITWGHDIRFCKNLIEAGWKVYLEPRVECGHWDVARQVEFRLPDESPPKKRAQNLNSKRYWDVIYGQEGANSWRDYPEMFQKVVDEVPRQASVVEIGCGVGILGSKLAAEKQVVYTGYDISETACEMAHARFLRAERKSVSALSAADLTADVIIGTEIVEHLIPEDVRHLFSLIDMCAAHKFIFTVPDNCFGPDETPEHQDLFNETKVREICAPFNNWDLRIFKADDKHLICIMERAPAPTPV